MDIDAILAEVSNQCASLPRGEYASKALSHSFVVFARDMVEVGSEYLSCACHMVSTRLKILNPLLMRRHIYTKSS